MSKRQLIEQRIGYIANLPSVLAGAERKHQIVFLQAAIAVLNDELNLLLEQDEQDRVDVKDQ